MAIDRIASMVVNQGKINSSDTIQSVSEVATVVENALKQDKMNDIDRINHQYETLIQEIAELKQMLLSQQRYIEERIEERDRKLIESIRLLQEQKQALLETSATKGKKGFFARLFSKEKKTK